MKILLMFISFFSFMTQSFAISPIEVYLIKAVEEQVHKECTTCVVQLEVLNKQVIEDIDKPDKITSDHWKGQTNLLLHLGEQTRIVTVNIRWVDKVVVANKNISIGQIVDKEDIRVIEKDVTYLATPYMQASQQAIGLSVRKVFQRGQILDESMLKKPTVVRYGQPLQIQIQEGVLKVVMNGTAKGAGAIGDRIPVHVNETGKRLFGKIISQNRVRVQ